MRHAGPFLPPSLPLSFHVSSDKISIAIRLHANTRPNGYRARRLRAPPKKEESASPGIFSRKNIIYIYVFFFYIIFSKLFH